MKIHSKITILQYKDSDTADDDIKDHDQQELYSLCKASFEAESSYFYKRK